MFGRKAKLEKRLAAGELRRVSARVLATHFLGIGTSQLGQHGPGEYRVKVRVEPPGEEPFEASLNVNASHVGLVPHEGGELPIAYDHDDHDAVIWDEQTARTASASQHAYDRERRERIAAERRAAGLPPVEADTTPDEGLQEKLRELQGRKDRGELTDWEFRTARAELFKEIGF